jgi:hypothetical protein
MNNNQIERNDKTNALDDQWRSMNAALERLGQFDARSRSLPASSKAGRLIFGLDLTASRSWSLKQARKATASMFATVATLGSVAVKLVFFRGDECKAGAWQDDADAVCRAMLNLSTATGTTKIGRILRLAADEQGPVSGVVYIGDHCEEDADELADLAGQLGEKHIPVFVFHECADDDDRWRGAKPVFRAIAAESGGAYCPFGTESVEALREMLSTVAAFSAAGDRGLRQLGQATTPEARQLQKRLLLGPAARE